MQKRHVLYKLKNFLLNNQIIHIIIPFCATILSFLQEDQEADFTLEILFFLSELPQQSHKIRKWKILFILTRAYLFGSIIKFIPSTWLRYFWNCQFIIEQHISCQKINFSKKKVTFSGTNK